ncbi:MAG TPA: hypothetical protein VNL18_06230 [Gemmatimonadales bacterium]|nr:hypothetical protein [Gemmatimonadales bacterium]
MGSKLGSKAQKKMDVIYEARRKWDRIHGLVEQYATQKVGEDMFLGQIARASVEVSRVFMNAGYGVMADQANQLAMLSKRGTGKQMKIRAMRDFVTAVKAAMERQEKMIIEEDAKAAHAED